MSLGELSGPLNGLIILTSASLAITQYVHAGMANTFKDARERLKQGWAATPDLLKAGDGPVEEHRQLYDALANKECRNVGWPLHLAFVNLCALSLVKVAEITVLLVSPQLWFVAAIPTWLCAVALAVLIIIVGIKLLRIGQEASGYVDDVARHVKQGGMLSKLLKVGQWGSPNVPVGPATPA